VVEVCSGIYESSGLESASVLPNPFNDKLQVQIGSETHSVLGLRLIDMLGRIIFRDDNIQLQPGLNTISLTLLEILPAGIYHIELQHGAHIAVKKALKSR